MSAKPKKPFTKNQKILLFGVVGAALVAIVVKSAIGSGPATHSAPPPPVPHPAIHATAKTQTPLPKPTVADSFVPTIHRPVFHNTTVTKSKKLKLSGGFRAMDLLQSASGGTAWGVYATKVPNEKGWYAVLYRASLGGENHFAVSWVNLPQKLLVLGTVLNHSGVAWSFPANFLLQAEKHGVHLPSADQSAQAKSTKALFQAWQATGIDTGKTGPLVTVYFDPNSPAAANLYSTLMSFARMGKIKVHWVPIAVLSKSSLTRAEYMLSAPVPSTVLKEDLAHFHFRSSQGGSPQLFDATTSMMEEIDGNSNTLAATGQVGPLSIFYCQGHTLHARYTSPSPSAWPELISTLDNHCSQ